MVFPQELKLPSAPEHFIQYFEDDNRPQVALDVNYENGFGVSMGRLREVLYLITSLLVFHIIRCVVQQVVLFLRQSY